MPAFKYRQKNSLIVFERGHKAHGYVQTADVFPLGNSSFPSSACRKGKLEVLDAAVALCTINAHEKFPVAQRFTIDI